MLALGLLAVLSFAGVAQAKEVPSGFGWTNYGPEMMSVSCVSANTCVAVGQGGAVLRSPNTADIPLAWTFVALKKNPKAPGDPVDLVGVTCSDTSCLAVSAPKTPTVDYGSWVYRSVDGGVTWTAVQQLPVVNQRKTNVGSAITCADGAGATAATRVCYVVGDDGGVWRSTDDGQSWTGIPLPATAGATASYDKVACASETACVAAGGDTTPTSILIEGTTITPLKTPAKIDKRFAALACDSATRCVGTGGQGNYTVLSIADKGWGPAHAFRRNPLQAGLTVKALSCPIAGSCVGLTGDGLALRTDALGDPDANWQRRPVADIIGTLDCVSTSCVGVGKMAAWYASFDLGGSFQRVNEVAKFDVIQCSPALSPICVAGGKENVGLSPTGGTLWSLPIADRGAFNTKVVRCSGPTTCLLYGQFEGLATTDMNVFRPRFGPVQSATGSEAQTCVTDVLCVAANESVVYTTFDGGVTQWSSNTFPKVRPMGISCVPGQTNPVTCFVASKDLILIGTMTQDAAGLPHWNWRYTNADADDVINAIACSPGGAQCTAVGVNGEVLTTVGGNLLDWSQQTIPPNVPIADRPVYTSVTCPQAGFCLAGGAHGAQAIVASTTNGWTDYSYDEIGDLRASPVLAGFDCESVNRCVAVGSTALVGTRSPAVAPLR